MRPVLVLLSLMSFSVAHANQPSTNDELDDAINRLIANHSPISLTKHNLDTYQETVEKYYPNQDLSKKTSHWSEVASSQNETLYYDLMSLRPDPEYFSDGLIMWIKFIYKNPRTNQGVRYDEVLQVFNADCSKQAFKIDEIIVKNKGKVVKRISNAWLTSYSYPEPASWEYNLTSDMCATYRKILDKGYSNSADFFNDYPPSDSE